MARRRRAASRRATHPERAAVRPAARDRAPKKSDERLLESLAAERRRLIRPVVLFGLVDVVLMALGPLCSVVSIPVVCVSLVEQVWLWFVPLLAINAILGSLGSRLIKVIVEQRRLSREVRPSTS